MKRWMASRRTALVAAGAVVIGLLAVGWAGSRYLAAMEGAAFWESAIADFEEQDRVAMPEPGVIVFTGSSSIRGWKTLADDMAPLRVVNRGFGGSQISHVSHYVPRIVHPYRPSAVVLYAGDNDLAKGSPKTAESVFGDFREFVGLVRKASPGVPVYFVAIKPSTQRWDRWPIMSEANARISAWAAKTDGVEYLDIATPMLKKSGEPRSELFIADGLHLSAEGYAVWTAVVRPVLLANHGS